MTQTCAGARQQSARNVTGASETYDGDVIELARTGGTVNERILNQAREATGVAYTNINDALAGLAALSGAHNFSSVRSWEDPTLAINWRPADFKNLIEGVTHSRTTTASYFDESGVLKWASGLNLLPHSNQFDSSWTTTGTPGIVQNETDPNGMPNSAWTITDNQAAGHEFIKQNIAVADDSERHIVSLYVKKEAVSAHCVLRSQLTGGTGVTSYILIDKSDGSITLSANTSIEEVEDDGTWLRLQYGTDNNGTGNTNLQVQFWPAVTAGFGAASGSSVIYGAQLEKSLFATPYVETGATAGTTSLPAFHHDPSNDNESLGILNEPLGTNIAQASEDLTDSVYTETDTPTAILQGNYAIGPDGKTTADLVGDTNTYNEYIWRQPITHSITAGETTTASVWAKLDATGQGDKRLTLRLKNYGGASENTEISPILLTEEWQRLEITHTWANNQTGLTFDTWAYNDVGGLERVLWYGVQVEHNAEKASSYIKTEGSSATRTAAIVNADALAAQVGLSGGTIVVKGRTTSWASGSNVLFQAVETTGDTTQLLLYSSNGLDFRFYDEVDSVNGFNVAGSAPAVGANFGICATYAEDHANLWINGVGATEDTSNDWPASMALESINIGNSGGVSVFNGTIAEVRVYTEPKAAGVAVDLSAAR